MASLVQLTHGTIFAGEFRVVRPLSEGGMGAVYVVEQVSTGKQRALKVMHPNLVHDQKQRQRFVQEAKIGARIESDHVVEVIGAGVDPGSETPWLAMELLAGETLDDRMMRGPMPQKEVAELFNQLCHAVAAAHDVGIVHRDLKPENVFLAVQRREGVSMLVKVLDFGIAKLVAESGHTTQAIGSPLWMAPEQTNVDAPISPSTDVWALGLLAFACLTGQSYWKGAHVEVPNPMSIVMEVCFEPLVPASVRAGELGVGHLLPAGFDEWFAQCVSRDMEARFKNARATRGALERLLTGAATAGAPMGASPSLPTPAFRKDLATAAAPELDLPLSKKPEPKPEPKPEAKPAVAPPSSARSEPRPEPKPERRPEPKPESRRLDPKPPERIVIPPIRPPPSRAATTPRPRVEAPPEKPFPWAVVGVLTALVVGGLWYAQRTMLAKPHVHEPTPTSGSIEPTKVATKTSSHTAIETCPASMARLPAGELVPGDPLKAVEPFCIDLSEVTVRSYAACVKSGKCTAAATVGTWSTTNAAEKAQRNMTCNAGKKDRDDHPVNCVDGAQAAAYCAARDLRLPTDTEWEWAARSAGARFKYPWGFEGPDVQLCWSGFAARTGTCPVAQYPKGDNLYGAHDLAGNVREWTATTITGNRLHCGSDWTDKGDLYQLGYCGQAPPSAKSGFVGFRCAKG